MRQDFKADTPVRIQVTLRVLLGALGGLIAAVGSITAWGTHTQQAAIEAARLAVKVELGGYPTYGQLQRLLAEERRERRGDERELRAWFDERLRRVERGLKDR